MKKIRILIFCVIYSTGVFAQNTATNFITEDCNGVTHNLFDSLASGKTVVIAWVMPCGPCAAPAYDAYTAVQNWKFSGHNVDFYLVDDFANTSCTNLVGWGNANNMSLSTFFSSSDISMSDYGSNGMPKVVVIGPNDAPIIYNENNSNINFQDIDNAINSAIGSTTDVRSFNNDYFNLSCFPNPASNILKINYNQIDSDDIAFEILDVLGKTISSFIHDGNSVSGSSFKDVDVSDLQPGIYFLNATSKFNQEAISFFVE